MTDPVLALGIFGHFSTEGKNCECQIETLLTRYRTKNLKRFNKDIVLKGIIKSKESKSWDFFEGPRRFRGSQKSEIFYFSKHTKQV